MQTRQTQVLRFFFLVYAAAAAFVGLWIASQRQSVSAWAPLGAMACSLIPFWWMRERDLPMLRKAMTSSIVGLLILTVGVFLERPQTGWKRQVPVLTLLVMAIAIRDGVRTNRAPLGALTLFSGSSTSATPRSSYDEQIREAAGQEERNRLARELHDSIKQQIFAIQTSAAAVQARFDTDATGAKVALEGVRSSAKEAMVEMEAMLDQLRATPLETVGLVEALKKQCEALQYRTGAKVQVDVAPIASPDQMRPGMAQALFRIAQEALANVARHARASQVKLTLSTLAGEYVMKVEDNGSGFEEDGATRTGMGLSNMKARATEMGGTLAMASSRGKGTVITVSLPLALPEQKPLPRAMKVGLTIIVVSTFAALLIGLVIKNDFPLGFAMGMGISGAVLAIKIFLGDVGEA